MKLILRQTSADSCQRAGALCVKSKMASGVRLSARLCFRVCTSSHCFTRTRRLTTNTCTYLWITRITNAINTVSPRRFYVDKKKSSFLDDFSSVRMQNTPQKKGNLVYADADTVTKTTGSNEGQDVEDPILQQMLVKYERYRQWLANIMGKDLDTFTEKDAKEAIEYLMPSGLYAKDARPLFEDPKKLYEQRAQVLDKHGRPLHAAFFTGQVGFHDLLFEIYEQSAKLNAHASDSQEPSEPVKTSGSELSSSDSEGGYSSDSSSDASLDTSSDASDDDKSDDSDEERSDASLDTRDADGSDDSAITKETESLDPVEGQGKSDPSVDYPDLGDISDTSDSKDSSDSSDRSTKPSSQPKMVWMGKLELERKIGETLTDKEYDVIIHRLKKLASHPNADMATPFLLRFLHLVPVQGMKAVEKTLNEKGEAFGVGHRKRAIAEVTVKKGTGNVTVNNVPMTQYFGRVEDRKQVMYPFLTVGAVGEYDVDCGVIGGGTSGQVGAIRLAISRALLNFEDSYMEPLQQAGLLIRDPRIKERKKPGQKRARKKFAWVRR